MEGKREESGSAGGGGSLIDDLSPEETPTEIESLCMNCGKQGKTRLLLTKIPHFKEIVLMAFDCPHCNFRSNEIQSAGAIQEKGHRLDLFVATPEDLNRQVVKSDWASVQLPELEFEIPANTQRGLLNTIEGFLMQTIEGLEFGLEERMEQDPETATKLKEFLVKLKECQEGKKQFHFIINDPSGNSYIENPHAPEEDPNLAISYYTRTQEQNQQLGISQSFGGSAAEAPQEGGVVMDKPLPPEAELEDVMRFPATCNVCGQRGETRMCLTNIPHFKEVIIMAFNCDNCGNKSNEVKAGGAINPHGRKISLKITSPEDLNRDILKSETAAFAIPELGLKLVAGTLGGKFTTVEGLLTTVRDDLKQNASFFSGDSSDVNRKEDIARFFERFDKFLASEEEFTIVLDDPVANSYIQNIYAPDDDPNMTIQEYERSWKQNEALGLNDMKTENYEEETTTTEDAQKEEQEEQK
ncbi:nucleolar zinc-finger protein [Balamuthia mandrillaris]